MMWQSYGSWFVLMAHVSPCLVIFRNIHLKRKVVPNKMYFSISKLTPSSYVVQFSLSFKRLCSPSSLYGQIERGHRSGVKPAITEGLYLPYVGYLLKPQIHTTSTGCYIDVWVKACLWYLIMKHCTDYQCHSLQLTLSVNWSSLAAAQCQNRLDAYL